MRKKILSQSMLILLIMIIGIFSCIPDADASQASFSCSSSVTVGEKIKVTLNLPANHDGQCTVNIKYSDGTTDSKDITYVKGMTDESVRTVSFDAKVVGTATVSSNNIFINDNTGKTVESNGSLSVNIDIKEKVQEQPKPVDPAPTNPTNPTTPTTPSTNTNTTTPTTTTNEVKFTDVNETVYTTDRVNLRKSYSTSSEKITTLAKDTKLTRTGVASNGWSRVNYNGQTAYIYTQYLAKEETQKPEEDKKEDEVKFTDVNKTMYAKQNCNLRKSWSTKSDLAGYLTKGEEVTVTGTADNGWTRIKYKNQDIYVATRLLVAEKPDDDEPEEKPDENTEEPEVPVEKTELEKLQEEIGVLPEVGNNIATQIYVFVAVISLVSSLAGLYYINKKEVK